MTSCNLVQINTIVLQLLMRCLLILLVETKNKSAGLNGICMESFIFAGDKLNVSLLFTFCAHIAIYLVRLWTLLYYHRWKIKVVNSRT